jgi:hypothetical protein
MRQSILFAAVLATIGCSDSTEPSEQLTSRRGSVRAPLLSTNANGAIFEPNSITSVTLQPVSYPRCHITLDLPLDRSDFIRYDTDGTRTFRLNESDATIAVTGTATGPFYVGVGKVTLKHVQRPIAGGWEVVETDVHATGFVGDATQTWRGICAYRSGQGPNPPTLRIDLVGAFH